ncbi:MAG TPA: cation-translocating P-type ATPase [Phycisphaerales bacterium]|nr:cation-translocating P-type ATPase [Phycisphaerales bacterium]
MEPPGTPRPHTPDQPSWLLSARGELWSSILAGALLLAGVLAWLALARSETGLAIRTVCSWTSLAIGMIHASRAAWESARFLRFDIDVLMVVGAVLAAAVGHPEEGALLLFLFVLSGALEDLASQRTQRAVEALHQLMPTKALRLDPDTREWLPVAPEVLVKGDSIKVLPGESMPADALVTLGRTSLNQASLTGESLPRSVEPGDSVFAGTINVGDPIELTVSRPAAESSLSRILTLVLQAQSQREPVQRMIDRISQPYAIGVVLASLATFAVWYWALHRPFDSALFIAITLLIVASPCAVIIATPTATLAAIARGARAGVLFKGGQTIERLAGLAAVAFDKTGTLTVGKMRVHALHPIGWSDERSLLAVAAGLEQDSTHPIATAVLARAAELGVEPAPSKDPRATPGRGVSAHFDGLPARLGTLVFVEDLIPQCLRAKVREVLHGVQKRGQIGTVVAHDDHAGVIILSDSVRPGADRLVADLHALGVKPVVMLTGDNKATAAAVAESLDLDRFHAECLPEDKLRLVGELRDEIRTTRKRGGVGVIGDGVNDAPALAAADVSIAIGSIGSDAALESADIVLLSDDLGVVPWAVGLARRARRTIRLNLAVALGAIAVMAVATLVGPGLGHPLPLWLGVLGHEGGTLLVVANSLLLLAYRSPIPSFSGENAPVSDRGPASITQQDAPVAVPAGK